METLVSLSIGAFLLYILFLQIDEYNQLIVTKFRFRFFALRDRLALLVAFHNLPEESWEYQKIVGTINFHITATERVSIMRIVEMLSEFHTSKDEERRVEVLSQRIDREDVKKLVLDFMSTTHDLIRKNSRAQIFCIMSVAKVMRLFHREPTERAKQGVLNPSVALNAIRSHSQTLAAGHMA